eukprot:COSAG06_NODE_16361_length_1005_cov_1.633554_3_plen_35_part_01
MAIYACHEQQLHAVVLHTCTCHWQWQWQSCRIVVM